MFDNNKQKLQYSLDDFDEDDDVILPDTYWGELVYIFYILRYMYRAKDKKEEFQKLLRQIKIHRRWMQINKEDRLS